MPAVSTPHTLGVHPRQIIQLHVEVVIKGTVIAVWLILSILPMVTDRFDTNLCSEIARKFGSLQV